MTAPGDEGRTRAKRDPRDGLIASQKTELDRLRRENKRLQGQPESHSTRRQKQLASLIEACRVKPKDGQKVLPPLTPPLMLARKMGAAIVRELREMAIETRALVRELAKGPAAKEEASQVQSAMDAPADGSTVSGKAQIRIEALQRRYRERFAVLADEWARKMIVGVEAQSTAQLTLGLKGVAERMEIISTMAEPRMRAIVEASTQSCVQLITRIPERYLGEVQIAVMSAITTGSGLDKLVPYLTERYEGDARRAHLVALDQVRKVSANVNSARLQEIGVKEYVWVHVGGERYPRKLHQSYSGRTFRYDDPPVIDEHTGERGIPGSAINCRCIARPVLRFIQNA